MITEIKIDLNDGPENDGSIKVELEDPNHPEKKIVIFTVKGEIAEATRCGNIEAIRDAVINGTISDIAEDMTELCLGKKTQISLHKF